MARGSELAEDVEVFLHALRALGVRADVVRDGVWLRVLVTGHGYVAPRAATTLQLGQNGTALRTFTAILGLLGGTARFDGDPGLRRRGLGGLVSMLEARGARFRFERTAESVPFTLTGCACAAPVELDLRVTSQAATGALLAFAGTPQGGELHVSGPRGYLDLTIAWLRSFGVSVDEAPGGIAVSGRSTAPPKRVVVPADPSAAAWLSVLAIGKGRPVRIEGLEDLGHPDFAMLEHLTALGASVEREGSGVLVSGAPGEGDYVVEGLADAPDLFPPLVVLLSLRPGTHTLRAAKLRGKESDRIQVLAHGMKQLGFDVDELEDGLRLRGSGAAPSESVELDPAQDHRMAMAFWSLLRLHRRAGRVLHPECVAKSWPTFFADAERVICPVDSSG